jgi:hypothetical protein
LKHLNKDIFVNPLSTIELNEPYKKTNSEKTEVWDEVEDESDEGVNSVVASIDHPVGQPMLIIIFV